MQGIRRQLALGLTLAFLLIIIAPALSLAAGTTPVTGSSSEVTASAAGTTGNTTSELPPVMDANGQPVAPGTLPSSPFYWLANIIERVQVLFTFDPAHKTALLESQALQNLAAARAMAKTGKAADTQTALNAYSQKVAEIKALLAKVQDAKTVQTLQGAIAKADSANIQVLKGLVAKLPAPAAKAVALDILQSMNKVQDKPDAADQQKVQQQVGQAESITGQLPSSGTPAGQTGSTLTGNQTQQGDKEQERVEPEHRNTSTQNPQAFKKSEDGDHRESGRDREEDD